MPGRSRSQFGRAISVCLTLILVTRCAVVDAQWVKTAGRPTVPETVAKTLTPPPATDPSLPAYALGIDLNPENHRVTVEQVVRWTNPGPAPTDRLVFQVVSNNRPDAKTIEIGKRTLESLRVDPRTALDEQGGRFHLDSARLDDQTLNWSFDPEEDTHLTVMLPIPVQPGQAVSVTLHYWIDLPEVQGRLGTHKGVTNLLNWYPVLTVYGTDGWGPVPYVAWHQPWLNEAGNYRVRLRVPGDHKVASGGRITSETADDTGHRLLEIRGDGLRDFTIVTSNRFEVYETDIEGIPVRVLALPEHQGQARLVLQVATDCIRTYSDWFGPYAYDEFEIVESYFGWNGNESSGLVMIDERILDTPRIASRYIEHLVSHEICHQWWYSAVGTDGYREPWVDEGLVGWFTQVRFEDRYGDGDPEILDLPGGNLWGLPNIHYNSLLHNGYSLYQHRGGHGQSLASLDDLGHLYNLFFLVYDKGARVTGMIQHRMGRERFFAFMRHLYEQYRFRIMRAADIERELEAFTGESWKQFFDDWLRSDRSVDWDIGKVTSTRSESGVRTVARIRQGGEIAEPVEIAFRYPVEGGQESELTLSLDPSDPSLATRRDVRVDVQQVSADEWDVSVELPSTPRQIEIDPDHWVLDSNPRNNRWHPEVAVRYSPLYTPLDEAAIVQPWQQQSIVFGPGIDKEARVGLFASLIEANNYRVTPFLAYTAGSNKDHVSAGIEAIFYNLPAPNWNLGARYEYSLLTTLQNTPGSQATFFARKILAYTTSLIYDNLSYFEFYSRIGDNFFPDQDSSPPSVPGAVKYNNVRALGVHFHADTRMPYWNPESGYLFDASYEHGFEAFGNGADYNRTEAQLSGVNRLPDGLGWLSDTRIAGRLGGGYGFETNGEHFRFGGPGRFRGRHPSSLLGNAFWVGSVEWRYPLTGELDAEVLDNLAALRSVWGSVFYDVGESYLFNQSQGGVDQAIGTGLYFDLPLLSFVEALTVRIEYARSVVNHTDAFWFGLYRAF
ncbi:BamA/TamA family outer membrane protein [bacterium]|nr:BamA/TamA family outer membrane protein [bacterium]